MTTPPTPLPIAVRVFPEPFESKPHVPRWQVWTRPESMLVFDAETRVDARQPLTFGSYRFVDKGRCLEEGLFFADDLPPRDRKVLTRYASSHRANVAPEGDPTLQLLTRREFLDKFFQVAYRTRGLVVGFNLPFDLSRLGFDVAEARDRYTGGFSLGLWSYIDPSGVEHSNRFRPRIDIKHIDSKRSVMGFAGRRAPDRVDQIPEGSATGREEPGYVFRGHFLDLRTLLGGHPKPTISRHLKTDN